MKKIFLLSMFLLASIASMAQKTLAQLQTEATTIRDETKPGANTANRVGSTFLDYANGFVPVIDYAVATGTNAYSATVNPVVTQYVHGQTFRIEFQNGNTGSSTLNINGIGSVLLTSDGSTALTSGMITAGQKFDIYYNGSVFQLNGGAGNASVPLSNITGLGTNWPTALGASLGSGWTAALNSAYSAGASYTADESTLHLTGSQFSIKSSFYSTSPTASILSQWDSNKNLASNNSLISSTSTITSGGTTTLTVSSTQYQYFTGSSNQTCILPVASTLGTNHEFWIYNNSTGAITVTTSGSNILAVMTANTILHAICTNPSGGTGLSSWTYPYYTPNPMTTTGDLIVGGSSGIPTRLADITAGIPLISGGVGATPLYQALDISSSSAVVNVLQPINGGIATTAAASTTGTISINLSNTTVYTITPTGAITFNNTGATTSQRCTFVITTSGTSSFTITWGTGFKTTGTLATGTVSGKVFTVTFVSDGSNYNECSRTTAM